MAHIDEFALNELLAQDQYPQNAVLRTIDVEALGVARQRRVFAQPKPEIIVPKHKTIVEYLVVRALARRINEKLIPLGLGSFNFN